MPAKTRARKLIRQSTEALNRALDAAIDAALLGGQTRQGICYTYQVSPERVTRRRAALNNLQESEQGAFTLPQLLASGLSGCIALAIFRLKEALLDNRVPANQLHICLGVLLDKHAQLSAGLVMGTERTQESVLLDRVKAEFELLRLAAQGTPAQAAMPALPVAQLQGGGEGVQVEVGATGVIPLESTPAPHKKDSPSNPESSLVAATYKKDTPLTQLTPATHQHSTIPESTSNNKDSPSTPEFISALTICKKDLPSTPVPSVPLALESLDVSSASASISGDQQDQQEGPALPHS